MGWVVDLVSGRRLGQRRSARWSARAHTGGSRVRGAAWTWESAAAFLRGLFRAVLPLPLGRPGPLGAAFGGNGQDLLQRRQSVDGGAEEGEVVLGRPGAGLDGHQQQADQGDVKLERHSLGRFREEVLEMPDALEPTEEQFDL